MAASSSCSLTYTIDYKSARLLVSKHWLLTGSYDKLVRGFHQHFNCILFQSSISATKDLLCTEQIFLYLYLRFPDMDRGLFGLHNLHPFLSLYLLYLQFSDLDIEQGSAYMAFIHFYAFDAHCRQSNWNVPCPRSYICFKLCGILLIFKSVCCHL